MSKFTVEYSTDSGAFDEEGDAAEEISRIFDRIKDRVAEGATGGVVFDVNGNLVGHWGWK